MASLNNAYNPDAPLPSDRDPIPADTYPVEITESDIAATSSGSGTLLKFTASVTDGDHKGRLIWGQLNLENSNAQAQEIGQSEFRALREVTGVLSPNDTEELHYKQFNAVIEIVPESKGKDGKTYKAKNQINWRKTVKLLEGGDQTPAGKSEPTKTAANDNAATTKAAPAKRPWGKKA